MIEGYPALMRTAGQGHAAASFVPGQSDHCRTCTRFHLHGDAISVQCHSDTDVQIVLRAAELAAVTIAANMAKSNALIDTSS